MLAPAIFPLGTRENARRDFDQARRQLEDRQSRPWLSVAGAEGALVQRIGHVLIGVVLDDHFCEVIQNLHFGGIVFEVQAIVGDAGAIGNLFTGD